MRTAFAKELRWNFGRLNTHKTRGKGPHRTREEDIRTGHKSREAAVA